MMEPLRILVVHNRYQQRGGEDEVVDAETALLAEHGHAVRLYQRDNDEIPKYGAGRTATESVWSSVTWRDLQAELEEFRPNLVHVHNTFPLISPSTYWAVARWRVPVVQTLHNFRLFCLQAMFLRNGTVCEDCLGRLPWPGVVHGCYRGSRSMSAVLGGTLGVHRLLRTYASKVTRYIALNRFCRDKFIEGGLPAERVRIKPNFVDIGPPEGAARRGALFVGRMSAEKGIDVLIASIGNLDGFELTAIGSGPDQRRLEVHPRVRFLGWQDQAAVHDVMRSSSYLVMPSIWFENFPRTLVEAFACGLPVVASRLGAMAEIIEHGRTGLLFEPNSRSALAQTLQWAEAHPHEMRSMGERARYTYEQRYTPSRNYDELMEIYGQAMAEFATNARESA